MLYVAVLKKRYNNVGRTFCDAINACQQKSPADRILQGFSSSLDLLSFELYPFDSLKNQNGVNPHDSRLSTMFGTDRPKRVDTG